MPDTNICSSCYIRDIQIDSININAEDDGNLHGFTDIDQDSRQGTHSIGVRLKIKSNMVS